MTAAAGPKYAYEIGFEVSMTSGVFLDFLTVAITRLRRSFLLHSGIPMVEEPITASEIARLIAYIQLGPWPVDLQLIIFSTTSGWRCGLSPATQTSDDARYREAVLKIARELQSTVALGREGSSGPDKEDPPA
jgi:hypothetical protein